MSAANPTDAQPAPAAPPPTEAAARPRWVGVVHWAALVVAVLSVGVILVEVYHFAAGVHPLDLTQHDDGPLLTEDRHRAPDGAAVDGPVRGGVRIGYVPQDPSFSPGGTVEDVVTAALGGVDEADRPGRVALRFAVLRRTTTWSRGVPRQREVG